ncbi:hypothetical protein YC2023_039947 [Brassica napus]
MEEMLGGLRNILTTVFLSAFAGYLVSPVMTDVTVSAVCSDLNDSCSLAVYLTGLQQVRNSEQGFFYTFYVVKTLFDLICQGTVDCLAQAYVKIGFLQSLLIKDDSFSSNRAISSTSNEEA